MAQTKTQTRKLWLVRTSEGVVPFLSRTQARSFKAGGESLTSIVLTSSQTKQLTKITKESR